MQCVCEKDGKDDEDQRNRGYFVFERKRNGKRKRKLCGVSQEREKVSGERKYMEWRKERGEDGEATSKDGAAPRVQKADVRRSGSSVGRQ